MSFPRPILKRSASSSNSADSGMRSTSSYSSYSSSSNSTAPSSYSYSSTYSSTSSNSQAYPHGQVQATPIPARTRKRSVHFPTHHPSGSPVTHTHYTHSGHIYDRSPIDVEANECKMPKRGARMYMDGMKIKRENESEDRGRQKRREARVDGKRQSRDGKEHRADSDEEAGSDFEEIDLGDASHLNAAFSAMSIKQYGSSEREKYCVSSGYSHSSAHQYYHPELDSFVATLDHSAAANANSKQSKPGFAHESSRTTGCLDGF